METFTLTMGGWLRPLFARNALVRTSDRIEAIALFAMILLAMLAAPVAGAVGTAVYDSRVHAIDAQRLTRHEVEATATEDSSLSKLGYQSPIFTALRWQFDGHVHTDILITPDTMKAGEQTSVWVDAAGDLTSRPLSDSDAAPEAVVAALGSWIVVAGAGAAACALSRFRLNQERYAAWDRELDDLADNGGRANRSA